MAHTPVKGHRELTEQELEDMNMLKEMEANVLAELDDLKNKATPTGGYTVRWLSIAKTHIQQGFMAANRAIARPNNEAS